MRSALGNRRQQTAYAPQEQTLHGRYSFPWTCRSGYANTRQHSPSLRLSYGSTPVVPVWVARDAAIIACRALQGVAFTSEWGSSSAAPPWSSVPVLKAVKGSQEARIIVDAGGSEVLLRTNDHLSFNSSRVFDGVPLNEAVKGLEALVHERAHVDSFLFYCVLKRCIAEKNLVLGRRVHDLSLYNGYESNTFVATHIIRMYASHGRLQEVAEVFSKVAAPDAFMWSSIISAYAEHGRPTLAIDLYRQMRQSSEKPNSYVYVAVLKACTVAVDLVSGKDVHADILGCGIEPDMFVGSCLVVMYSKCGSLTDARRVFDKLPTRNVITWTSMIAAYAQHGLGQEALALYAKMLKDGMTPADRVTFVCLLQACASIRDLHQGKQLHSQLQKRGLEGVLGNSLVDMYSKCGSLLDARRVFDRLPTKDVVTWTTMIAGYAQDGLGQEALALYSSMQQDGMTANRVTFICLLQACASLKSLHQGRQFHSQIQKRGFEADVKIINCLIDMYAKCDSLVDAQNVFDKLPTRDVVTWTTMIGGYARHGLGEEALALYARMQHDGLTPADPVTFACLLQVCTRIGGLSQGKQVHAQIQQRGLEADVVVGSCLVDMYAKCGSLADARGVFDRLPTKNVVTWTAMIAGYAQHGLGKEALALYDSMQQVGITPANHVTFVCLLQACASVGALDQGKQLHAQIQQRGLDTDIVVGNCLLTMYSKCGSLEDARRVFDSLPTRDVVTWTSMISGYVQHGFGHEALAFYAGMQQDDMTPSSHVTFMCLLQACASVGALHQGKQLHTQIQQVGLDANVVVSNCLIDMYAKCGSLDDARRVFDRLAARDVVTWTTLLNGYAEHSDCQRAMQCFKDMLEQGVKPDDATFACLLVACSHDGLVDEGLQYFKMMVDDHNITPSVQHYNCVVDLLGRSGRLEEAEKVLISMPVKNDVVGWTSLLSACKSHGDVERARRCFEILVDLEPQNGTAYVLLANIYAHAGRWRDVDCIEALRKSAGAKKKAAKACIELQKKVYEFTVGEETGGISRRLRSINLRLKEEGGHVPHTDLVLNAVAERHKEDALCGHAEKLALAYGLLNTPGGTTLLVTKNLRMCNDCHSGTKVMSRLEKREIIVRDAHRVHRFLDGFCSCGDRH